MSDEYHIELERLKRKVAELQQLVEKHAELWAAIADLARDIYNDCSNNEAADWAADCRYLIRKATKGRKKAADIQPPKDAAQ